MKVRYKKTGQVYDMADSEQVDPQMFEILDGGITSQSIQPTLQNESLFSEETPQVSKMTQTNAPTFQDGQSIFNTGKQKYITGWSLEEISEDLELARNTGDTQAEKKLQAKYD